MAIKDFVNSPQLVSLAWKVIPFAGGILVGKGWLSQTSIDYVMQNQSEITGYIGVIAAAAAGAWSLWKNRPGKIVADTAAIPGVDVKAPPELAAQAKATTTNDNVKASITAKAA